MESYFFGLVLSKVVNHIFWISLFNLNKPGLLVYTTYISDAVNGWAGWALAYLEFGSSVSPIPTRGSDFAHHITACTPDLKT